MLDFLRGCTGLYVGQEADCRRFVEAVLWINRSHLALIAGPYGMRRLTSSFRPASPARNLSTRSGAQWRLLPAEY